MLEKWPAACRAVFAFFAVRKMDVPLLSQVLILYRPAWAPGETAACMLTTSSLYTSRSGHARMQAHVALESQLVLLRPATVATLFLEHTATLLSEGTLQRHTRAMQLWLAGALDFAPERFWLLRPRAIHVMQFNMRHGGPFSVDAALRELNLQSEVQTCEHKKWKDDCKMVRGVMLGLARFESAPCCGANFKHRYLSPLSQLLSDTAPLQPDRQQHEMVGV